MFIPICDDIYTLDTLLVNCACVKVSNIIGEEHTYHQLEWALPCKTLHSRNSIQNHKARNFRMEWQGNSFASPYQKTCVFIMKVIPEGS